jgi:hypothetical protein
MGERVEFRKDSRGRQDRWAFNPLHWHIIAYTPARRSKSSSENTLKPAVTSGEAV